MSSSNISTLHNHFSVFKFVWTPLNVDFVFSGVAIIYNLPEKISFLNISARVLAAIYRGTLKNWDENYIQKYNPKIALPNKKILTIARSDEDITTTMLTKTLSDNDPLWNATYGIFSKPDFVNDTCCNTTRWPPNTIHMYGEEVVGILGLVKSIPYSIGYATLDIIEQYNINFMGLLKSGDFVSQAVLPNVDNIQKSMQSFINRTKEDSIINTGQRDTSSQNDNSSADKLVDDSHFDMSSYPLATYISMVINYTYDPKIDCCVIQELVGFIDWMFIENNDKSISSLGFIPIVGMILYQFLNYLHKSQNLKFV